MGEEAAGGDAVSKKRRWRAFDGLPRDRRLSLSLSRGEFELLSAASGPRDVGTWVAETAIRKASGRADGQSMDAADRIAELLRVANEVRAMAADVREIARSPVATGHVAARLDTVSAGLEQILARFDEATAEATREAGFER